MRAEEEPAASSGSKKWRGLQWSISMDLDGLKLWSGLTWEDSEELWTLTWVDGDRGGTLGLKWFEGMEWTPVVDFYGSGRP